MHPMSIFDRRKLFHWGVSGLGATALIDVLRRDGHAASGPPTTHFAPRAKRAIHICLVGGLSHLDSFDYKPELEKHHGKPLGTDEKPDIFFGKVGLLRRSDWDFKQRGASGLWLSEMFPHIARRADDLTVIRSMVSGSANHTPALFFENSGAEFNGFPAAGSWLSFGLGSETEDLPAYVVLPDGHGAPNGGASNWSNGFLPSQHQGVVFHAGSQPVQDLFPARHTPAGSDADVRDFLTKLNTSHQARTGPEELLQARIRSYALAARMQLSVPEVSELSDEPQRVLDLTRPA